jgi:fucose permease
MLKPRSPRVAIAAMFFVNGVLFSSWAARIPAIKQNATLTDATLGAALFAIGLGTVFALPITGWLIARIGSRRLTVWAALASCVVLPFAGLAASYWTLVAVLPLFGAAMAVMDVSMNSQASILEQRYGRSIMSSFHGVWAVGSIAGASLAGVLAAQEVRPFVHFVAVNAGLILCVAATGAQLLPRGDDEQKSGFTFASPFHAKVVAIGMMGACGAMVEGGIADWSGVYLRDVLQTSYGFATNGLTAFACTMAIGRFFGDRLIDRFGAMRVFRTGAMVAAVALAATLSSRTPHLAVACLAVAGAGLSVVFPIAFSAAGNIRGLSPGAAIAAVATAAYSGQMMGPPLIGFAAGLTSLSRALVLLVLLCVVMMVLSKYLSGKRAA